MSKVYELIKDIEQPNDHCLKAGVEFKKCGGGTDHAYVSECGRRSFHPAIVENPDSKWFKLKEEEKPKEWEIITFTSSNPAYSFRRFSDGFFRCEKFTHDDDKWTEEELLNHKTKTYTIYAVKRLSDGEVFTIGDNVCLSWYPPFTVYQSIDKFEMEEEKMFIHYSQNGKFNGKYELQYAMLNKKEQPVPTDDFVWDDNDLIEFSEYVGLRVGKNVDIRQQVKLLLTDFKLHKTHNVK